MELFHRKYERIDITENMYVDVYDKYVRIVEYNGFSDLNEVYLHKEDFKKLAQYIFKD
jgi:hypothetical protein